MSAFENISKTLRKHQNAINKLLLKAEALAEGSGDKKAILFIEREKRNLQATLDAMVMASQEIYPVFQKELKKKTARLQVKIKNLNHSKDILKSDNFLLEYKKKDLLLVTAKLEEANEEISTKNRKLLEHQEMIEAQTEQISQVHGELLAKNEELERQKEALLDQSDYLHEANQTITNMHREVQKQKNEILRKNEELLTLNQEKNNLIGIVAHDLKSPLNQIRGLLSLMKITSKDLTPEALSYIEMIEKSSGKLTDMIAKILDVEAIESKQMNLSFESVNLGDVAMSLVDRYTITASQKNITICTDIQHGINAYVDKGYTEQILENLISNAIKFSPRDKHIFVNVRSIIDDVVCEVRDEGPGITESDKKKLFGKYQKLSARPTGNETSTGLGLSIVKKFVVAMNGAIWCESEEGRGASFIVSFPKKATDESADLSS